MANEGDIPELKIEITGDSSSAQRASTQATQGLRDVTGAANQAGAAASGLGGHGASAFGKLVQGGRAAHGAMMGLNTAMQGGASTAIGLARALNDVFLLVTAGAAAAGPWALLALGIGVVLGAMRGLSGHAHAAAKGMSEASNEAKIFKDQLAALEKESKITLKSMEQDVKALTESWGFFSQEIDKNYARMKALHSAEHDLTKATLDQQEIRELAGTPEAGRQEVRDRFAKAREASDRQFKDNALENEKNHAAVKVQAAEKTASDLKNKVVERRGKLVELESDAAEKTQAGLRATRNIQGTEGFESNSFDAFFGLSGAVREKSPAASHQMREAIATALAAQRNLRDFKEKLVPIEAESQAASEKLQTVRDDAKNTNAVVGIKQQTGRLNQSNEVNALVEASHEKTDRERGAVQSRLDALPEPSFGDRVMGTAVARSYESQVAKLTEQINGYVAIQAERDEAIFTAFKKGAKQSEKTTRQVQNASSYLGQ